MNVRLRSKGEESMRQGEDNEMMEHGVSLFLRIPFYL